MATTATVKVQSGAKPTLVVFSSRRSGLSRRLDSVLATALQRRRNHDTFNRLQVDVDERPDIAARFAIERAPALMVVEDGTIRLRMTAPDSLVSVEQALRPWLR